MYQLQRSRDAAQAFHKAIANQEELGNSYFYLARIMQENNESQKSLDYYLRAIKYKSNQKDISQRFSQLLSHLKKSLPYSQHKSIYENAYKKNLYHPDIVYFMVKQAYNRLGYDEILEISDKIKENEYFKFYRSNSRQNTSFIYYYIALSYLNEKKDQPKALHFSSLSLKYEANFKAAKSLFKKLRKGLSKRYNTYLDKANQLLIGKKFEPAKAKFEQALSVNPEADEAKQGLKRVKAAKKSFEYTTQAENFIDNKQLTKALKPLKWAITLYKDNFKAKSLLEKLTRQITESLQIKDKNETKSQNLDNQFLKLSKQADNLLESKDFEEAIEKYTEALKLKPKNSRVSGKLKDALEGQKYFKKYHQAKKLHSKQNFAKTAQFIEDILKHNYYYEGIDFLLLDSYYQNKDYEKVKKYGEKLLSSQPRNKEVLYLLVVSSYYANPGDREALNQAIEYLSIAVEIDSIYLDSKSKLRRFQREKYTPFVIALFASIALLIVIIWFIKTRGLRQKARFLRKLETYLEKAQFQKIVALYPESLYVDISMSESLSLTPTFIRAFVETGEYNTAINHGTQFLKTQKNHKQVMISLGRSFYAIEKVDSYTIQFFLAVIGSEYATQDFVSYVGKKCFDQGLDDKKYDSIFLEFSKIYPEHSECRTLLLKHLKDTKIVTPQILKLLQTQVQFDEKDTRSRLQLAEYYLSKRQIEKCIELCEEVINLNVTEKKLHELLFSAYEKMGNVEDLIPIYKSLLEVYPNSTVLQQASNKIKLTLRDAV